VGGFVDAVGDYTIVDDKWGPSVGWFQYRTLHDPYAGYPAYDAMRDIGILAGRGRGVEQAPDEATVDQAAMAQAKAMWTLRFARGWEMWTIYRTGKYKEALGRDYDLRLGHPTRDRWNLRGVPA